MTTEIDILLKAVDEASAVLSGAAGKIKGSMGDVEEANTKVEAAQKKTEISTKDLVTGFSGVATAGFALYMTIDRVEKSQFALDKANLAVTRSNESLDQAQKNVNEALVKYGVGSTQAKDAADKLSIAQDANALANERVHLAQGNVNQAIMQGALTVIPSLITMVSSASSIMMSLTGAETATAAAQQILNLIMEANPILIVVAAVTALIAILVVAYYTIEPFRNAVDSLGRFLGLIPPAADDAVAATEQYRKATESASKSVLEAQQRVEATSFAAANFTNTLLDTARQVSGYDELLTRNCRTLEDYRGLSDDAEGAVEDLQGRMKSLASECEATNRVLEDQISNLGAGSAAVTFMGRDTDRLTVQEKNSGSAIDELNRQIAENTSLTEQQVAAIKTQIEELLRVARRAKDTADLMENLSTSYGVLKAAADASLPLIARQFDEAFKSGRIEDATSIVVAFADRLGISFEDAKTVLEGFISDVDKAAQRVTDFTDSMTNDYEVMQAKADSSLGAIHNSFMAAFNAGDISKAQELVTTFAAKYGISLEDARTVIEGWTAAVETSTGTVVASTETVISEFDKFKTKITGQFELAKAAADSDLSAIASAFDTAFDAGRFNDAAGVVQAFANKYGISFDQAELIINSFTDAQAKELAQQVLDTQKAVDDQVAAQQKFEDAMLAHADKIKTDYFDRVTAESSEFKDMLGSLAQRMVDSWNTMSGGTEASTADIRRSISAFAYVWDMTWDEAYNTISKAAGDIDAAAKLIPLSIEQQLIGKAQDDFQKFKDCVTGKSASLASIASADIAGMARNITDLISSGLVGEAQTEMQAYVDCNTNKTATMVTDITDLMDKLTKDYNAQLKAMLAEAGSLTGLQKDAVLRNISALTAGYEEKMANLRTWQQLLLQSMVTDVDRAAGSSAARLASITAALTEVEVGTRSATTKLETRLRSITEALREAADAADAISISRGGGTITAMATGGIVESPTLALIGEHGREAVIPLEGIDYIGRSGMKALAAGSEKPSIVIQITGPLVQIQGNADRATAELAASMVQERLRSVIFEASSSGAPGTSKMIRVGNRVVI